MPEPPPHEEGCTCQWCLPDLVAKAKIGMIALVDEATGYQNIRPKDYLQREAERLDASTSY